MKKAVLITFTIGLMISCQNTQSKTIQEELLIEKNDITDCNIKTTNRPDGNVIRYFNPIPIIQNDQYDIALSLYLNETTSTYLISVAVLFKSMDYKNLTGDLIIQTNSTNGIKLKQVVNSEVTMNGETLSIGMYELSNRDIEILKKSSLKSVFVDFDKNLYGNTVSINHNLIVQQFECFSK